MINEYKIKGWIARDYDGTLMLYAIKPHRCVTGVWLGGEDFFPLPKKMFPDLDTKNGPIEVELTIKAIQMVERQFAFHYDTPMLSEHINELSPYDVVHITLKKG